MTDMPRKIICSAVVLFGFLFFVFCNRAHAAGGYVDVHIHVDPTGLKQRKPAAGGGRYGGMKQSQGVDYAGLAKNIIALMNKMGVEKAVLIPPPQVPHQEGIKGSYTTSFSLAKYYPERILVGAGGEVLNPLIYQYNKDQVTAQVRKQFREEAERLIKSGVVVFGEMTALHLSMQEHHKFMQADPDHPLFLLLADIAAENNIPIDLHMEAIPQDIPTPESILKASSLNPDVLKANIGGLERLLEHNLKAKIVWQHIGWDNVGYMTPGLMADLLTKHPNLYLALRVENRQLTMDKSGLMPNRIVDQNWKVKPEWAKLISDFSDRIVIGSDDFMGLLRQQSRPKDSFVETWGILGQFSEEIAGKIGRANAARIYNLY